MEHTKCWVKILFNQISKMWVLQILREIYLWKNTFTEIKKSLWKISSKTLSERLSDLQQDWFVVKEMVSITPLKIQYSLTQKWLSFSKETERLNVWANEWWY